MMSVNGLDPCMCYLFGLTDYKLIKTKVPIEVLFMVQSINVLLTDISYLMSHSLISLIVKQKHPIWKEHMGQNDKIIHISLHKERSCHLTIACVSYSHWYPLNWLKIKTSWGWALPS